MEKKEVRYRPKGVCSREFRIVTEEDRIVSIQIVGGCEGNLQGICRLLEGERIDRVIERLSGIDCGGKGTSCPDQIARALKEMR